MIFYGVCFYKQYKRENETPIDDREDENPVYGLYTVHADPVAEAVDTNEDYYTEEDTYWQDATRVTSNNSNYSFSN